MGISQHNKTLDQLIHFSEILPKTPNLKEKIREELDDLWLLVYATRANLPPEKKKSLRNPLDGTQPRIKKYKNCLKNQSGNVILKILFGG